MPLYRGRSPRGSPSSLRVRGISVIRFVLLCVVIVLIIAISRRSIHVTLRYTRCCRCYANAILLSGSPHLSATYSTDFAFRRSGRKGKMRKKKEGTTPRRRTRLDFVTQFLGRVTKSIGRDILNEFCNNVSTLETSFCNVGCCRLVTLFGIRWKARETTCP